IKDCLSRCAGIPQNCFGVVQVETLIRQSGSGAKHGLLRRLDSDTDRWRKVVVVAQVALSDVPGPNPHIDVLCRTPIRLKERINLVLMRIEQRVSGGPRKGLRTARDVVVQACKRVSAEEVISRDTVPSLI